MQPGDHLGRYRLKGLLGAGGMAQVWEAIDENLGRTVAIKVIRDDAIDDPKFRARFQREARLIANLEHENILPVFDSGTHNDIAYLVMPLVSGGSLKEKLKSGVPPSEQAIQWLRSIAEALDYAHSQGILHRDIKPANILISRTGRLLLADFGLAKSMLVSDGLSELPAAKGTPIFIAPEQISGRKVSPQSDQYGLGVLAFYLLTGAYPFEIHSWEEAVFKHLHEAPPPPSGINASLSREVDETMIRALAKKPEDRFPTCTDFVATLAEALRRGGKDVRLEDDKSTVPMAPGEAASPISPRPPDSASPEVGSQFENAPAVLPQPPRRDDLLRKSPSDQGRPDKGLSSTVPGPPFANAILPVDMPGPPHSPAGRSDFENDAELMPVRSIDVATPDQWPELQTPKRSWLENLARSLPSKASFWIGIALALGIVLVIYSTSREKQGTSTRTPELKSPSSEVATPQPSPEPGTVEEAVTPPRTYPLAVEPRTAKEPLRVGGEVKVPRLIRKVEPTYPEAAQKAHMEGVVILEAIIDAYGLVESVKVLKSVNPLLDAAAVRAVQQWTYNPATLKGQAVPVYLTVTVTFHLTEEDKATKARPAARSTPETQADSLRRRCNAGVGDACLDLGRIYRTGEGVDKDDPKAARFYQEGCDAGSARGCTLIGWMYEYGHGVSKDGAQAAALYMKGCDGGDATGCAYLGQAYEYGQVLGKDLVKAVTLYRKGCSGGAQYGCEQLKRLNQPP